MSAYPESMRYFLDEVNGMSTNVFKLEPQNSNSAVANRILRFTLPANSLLNLRSFKLFFNISTKGTDAGGRLPAGIDRLVNRVEVTCGGVQLAAGSNYYNVLQQAKKSLEGNDLNGQLGHPDCVRALSYVNNNNGDVGQYPTANAALVGAFPNRKPLLYNPLVNETYSAAHNQTQFAIEKWDGFLGSCEPSILDSSLVPDIVISIFLDDDSVLASVKGPYLDHTGEEYINNAVPPVATPWNEACTAYSGTPATWEMQNIHATIECIGLSDGVLDALEASIIAEQGSLRVPFKQFFAFQDTTANTMRFNVATQSLDRIWVAHRKGGTEPYTAGNGAGFRRVEGTKYASIAGIKAGEGAAGVPTAAGDMRDIIMDAGVASYDSGGNDIVEDNHEEYMTAKFELQEPPASGTPPAELKQLYQFSLNGAYYPQFQATFEEMVGVSRNSVQNWREDHISLFTQKQNYSAQCIRLCLPQTGVRKISGFDTRSVSLNGYYNMYNVGDPRTLNLFCECTSVLRIGEARQLEVVQ